MGEIMHQAHDERSTIPSGRLASASATPQSSGGVAHASPDDSEGACHSHRAHIEPLLGTASREELVNLVLASADAVDRQQAQIQELMTALNLVRECGQRTVDSEKRMFKAVETAAKVLTAAMKTGSTAAPVFVSAAAHRTWPCGGSAARRRWWNDEGKTMNEEKSEASKKPAKTTWSGDDAASGSRSALEGPT